MPIPEISKNSTAPSASGRTDLPTCVSAIRDLTLISSADSSYREVPKALFEQVEVIRSEGVFYVVRYHDGERYRVNRLDVEAVEPCDDLDWLSENELPTWSLQESSPGRVALETLTDPSVVEVEDLLPLESDDVLPAVPAPPARPAAESPLSPTPVRTLKEWKQIPAALEPPKIVVPMLAAVGRLLLLAAREKVGKSTLCAWLLATLSTGRELFGQKIAPQKLLWISFEEAPDQVVPRFLAMDAGEDEVSYIDGWEMVAANTMPEVYRIIRTQRSALVVIDSLSRMATRGGDVRNENDSSEWVPVFDGLKAAATASGSAVVLLHHTSKVTNEPRGSTMITSAVDDVAIMSRVGRDKRTLRIKVEGRTFNNTFALLQADDGMGFSEVPLVTTRATTGDELDALIVETLLASSGISATALTAKLGKKKSLVAKAIDNLVAAGTLERTGSGPRSGLRVVAVTPNDAHSDEMKLAA